jgi:hypothetical protein
VCLLAGLACLTPLGVHMVPEGHVGVYWRGGALLSSYSKPGVHLKLPLVTSVHSVQITMQSDEVTNIPCGTRGRSPSRHAEPPHSHAHCVLVTVW